MKLYKISGKSSGTNRNNNPTASTLRFLTFDTIRRNDKRRSRINQFWTLKAFAPSRQAIGPS